MSEVREPPKMVWWHCYACGANNGPRDTMFCSICGRNKSVAMDEEVWRSFFTADATIVEKGRE